MNNLTHINNHKIKDFVFNADGYNFIFEDINNNSKINIIQNNNIIINTTNKIFTVKEIIEILHR